MLKLIGIIFLLAGGIFLLSWGSGPASSAMGSHLLDFGIGALLLFVGFAIYTYDPLTDVKKKAIRVVEENIDHMRDRIPDDGEESFRKIEKETLSRVRNVQDETYDAARKRIHQLAKEVETLTK